MFYIYIFNIQFNALFLGQTSMAPAVLLPKDSMTWVQTFVEKADVTNTVKDVHIGYLSSHHFEHLQMYP